MRRISVQKLTFTYKLEPLTNNVRRFLFIAGLLLCMPPHSAFAQCTETWNGGTGSWNTAANWSPAKVPVSTSNTCINSANAAVTIPLGGTTSDLTLALSTDSVTVGAGTNLTVDGTAISNAGTITLSGTSNEGAHLMVNANTVLSGAGNITLSNSTGNIIEGSGTLTNQQTIQGTGVIGDNSMTLVNSGTIDANNSGSTLTITPK